MRRGGTSIEFTERDCYGFFAPKPSCTAAGLTNEGSELSMKESTNSLVSIYVPDDAERCRT